MAEWIKCDSGHECSTHEHMYADAATATWRFESGGVGSYYCEACKRRIEAHLARRPARAPSMQDHLTPSLADEIRGAINRRSRENVSNTPDYILAQYMLACLNAFEVAVGDRDAWYDIKPSPGWPKPDKPTD